MHVPFHRAGNERTQTDEHTLAVVASGVLRGYSPQGSQIPCVKAWAGPLPTGRYGLEFTTEALPDPRGVPTRPLWRAGSPGVRLGEDEGGPYAEIDIVVLRVVLSEGVKP